MKQQRFRFKLLALLLFGMFALLAAYGGYSILTNGSRWFASSHNPRLRAQKQQVTAGKITDRDGMVLAQTDAEGNRVYAESESVRRAVVHVVGDADGHVRNGVESFQARYLYGFEASVFERIGDLISGAEHTGDTVQLTLSAPLCEAVAASFVRTCGAEAKGAAVVMDYRTGEVLAMVSLGSYDPMDTASSPTADRTRNRATAGLYAPGEAFGPVTAACMLAEGQALPDGSLAGAEASVTDRKLRETAETFGYNDNVLFRDLIVENAVYPTDGSAADHAAGRGGILATPVHLCMMAAGIANDGTIMEPRLLLRVTSSAGASRLGFSSAEYRRPLSPESAAALKARLAREPMQGGITGIACVSGGTAIFVGYLDTESLPYAVCVVVEGGSAEQVRTVAQETADRIRERFGAIR